MTTLLISLLLAATSLVAEPVPEPAASISASQSMIWDPATPAVVMMAEPKFRKKGLSHADEPGVKSVDPVTGKIRWTSKSATVPLLTWKGKILCLIESHGQPGLPLVLLDGRTGAKVRSYPLLREAGGHGTRVGEAMQSSFELTATRSGDVAFISWKTASWYVGGVPAPRNYRAGGGTVTFDLVAGTSLGVASRHAPPEGLNNPYLLPTPGPIPYGIAPFEIDGVRCELAFTGTGNGADVLLRRTKDGQPLPDSRLGASKPGYVHVRPSIDLRHLLRTDQRPDPLTGTIYRCTIIAAVTGEKASEFDCRGTPARFVVHRNRIISFLEGGVIGLELGTGELRWSAASRYLRYNGPYPP